MDYAYALAFALANNSLCLFAGAGLSKHLSAGAMPGWYDLLELACDRLNDVAKAKSQLAQANASFPTEDCAQIVELAFLREEKDFRKTLCDILSAKGPDAKSSIGFKKFLSAHPGVDVITTNYDTLIERLLGAGCNSNYPGKPVARRDAAVNVYHIHGCESHPDGMVVTTNDYYRFINSGGYFAQKVATILHENSTLIVGYSLSDPNLKAILNAYRATETRSINRANLFYVTRSNLPVYIKDYYETAYGITAIEKMEIDDVLAGIEGSFADAQQQAKDAESNLQSVLAGTAKWTDDYIKLRASLSHIVATANMLGIDIHSVAFTRMLGTLLEKKMDLTKASGAWDQYGDLAEWLVYLGSMLDVANTVLEAPYLDAVTYSMKQMASNYVRGYSWDAFKTWKGKWENLTFQNRLLLRKHAQANLATVPDALAVCAQ